MKQRLGYGHQLAKEEKRKAIVKRLLNGGPLRFGDGHFLSEDDLRKIGISTIISVKTVKK